MNSLEEKLYRQGQLRWLKVEALIEFYNKLKPDFPDHREVFQHMCDGDLNRIFNRDILGVVQKPELPF